MTPDICLRPTLLQYPPELENHSLVLFNPQEHHDIVLAEDPHELQLLEHYKQVGRDLVESFLLQLDVWTRHLDGRVLAHLDASQFQLFQEAMARKGIVEFKMRNPHLGGEHRHSDFQYSFDVKNEVGSEKSVDDKGDVGGGPADWFVVDPNLQKTADEVAEAVNEYESYPGTVHYPECELYFENIRNLRRQRTEPSMEFRPADPKKWNQDMERELSSCYHWNVEEHPDSDKLLALINQCIDQWNAKFGLEGSRAQGVKHLKPSRVDVKRWWSVYHTHEEIKDYYLTLMDDYPELMSFVPSIGKTAEGRDIFAVRITAKDPDGSVREKPQVWIQGLQHAREWDSGTIVQVISHNLLKMYGRDTNITRALDEIEFVIVSIVNVDGYHHTWTTNRFWRKNRRQAGNHGSWGVDLNRNWDETAGTDASVDFQSYETFPGPHAASEPEVQALQAYFLQQKNIIAALDIHGVSCSGGADPFPKDKAEEYETVRKLMVDAFGTESDPFYRAYSIKMVAGTPGSASQWFSKAKSATGKEIYSFGLAMSPLDAKGQENVVFKPSQFLKQSHFLQGAGISALRAIRTLALYAAQNPL
ncbi:hypothetical protein BC939DRAFT_510702 [Gamsiella multidivaricata]|uniref:uncharacterized protein n=1 Tax=Gamsiella multidivaricata TaxID=101098 RepID=UPI00221ECDFB|nr:uncharacterized protein BC939DRAFT_510702 [Gamsiella multidivaricata]KAG0353911.1 hypothetical protein BGZ54_001971 [Gamsiella multidivaricata]KAI7816588.1 hypothetical protein BC939DRAFT_510702 [Gamsiella multidivaricata]